MDMMSNRETSAPAIADSLEGSSTNDEAKGADENDDAPTQSKTFKPAKAPRRNRRTKQHSSLSELFSAKNAPAIPPRRHSNASSEATAGSTNHVANHSHKKGETWIASPVGESSPLSLVKVDSCNDSVDSELTYEEYTDGIEMTLSTFMNENDSSRDGSEEQPSTRKLTQGIEIPEGPDERLDEMVQNGELGIPGCLGTEPLGGTAVLDTAGAGSDHPQKTAKNSRKKAKSIFGPVCKSKTNEDRTHQKVLKMGVLTRSLVKAKSLFATKKSKGCGAEKEISKPALDIVPTLSTSRKATESDNVKAGAMDANHSVNDTSDDGMRTMNDTEPLKLLESNVKYNESENNAVDKDDEQILKKATKSFGEQIEQTFTDVNLPKMAELALSSFIDDYVDKPQVQERDEEEDNLHLHRESGPCRDGSSTSMNTVSTFADDSTWDNSSFNSSVMEADGVSKLAFSFSGLKEGNAAKSDGKSLYSL